MKLAEKLGFVCEGENPLYWAKASGQKEYAFYLTSKGIIMPFMRKLQQTPVKNRIVVLPGGRAGLMGEKLHRNLYLAQFADKLHFLKFRHLKELSALTRLTQDKWTDQLEKDPLQWSTPRQISILDSIEDLKPED